MPPYVETYSADMRDALFRAAIDRGMTVRDALRAAAAGDLEPLPAADQQVLAGMAYGYACELVRDEKERRGAVQRVRADATEAARQLAARLLALADREVTRLERARPKEPVDTARGIAAAKMAREALTLARDATHEPKPTGKPADAPTPRPQTLAAAIAAGEHSAPDDATDNPGASDAPATNTKNSNTHNTHDDAVRSRAVSSRADAPGTGA